jgi:hypothetical protein
MAMLDRARDPHRFDICGLKKTTKICGHTFAPGFVAARVADHRRTGRTRECAPPGRAPPRHPPPLARPVPCRFLEGPGAGLAQGVGDLSPGERSDHRHRRRARSSSQMERGSKR